MREPAAVPSLLQSLAPKYQERGEDEQRAGGQTGKVKLQSTLQGSSLACPYVVVIISFFLLKFVLGMTHSSLKTHLYCTDCSYFAVKVHVDVATKKIPQLALLQFGPLHFAVSRTVRFSDCSIEIASLTGVW